MLEAVRTDGSNPEELFPLESSSECRGYCKAWLGFGLGGHLDRRLIIREACLGFGWKYSLAGAEVKSEAGTGTGTRKQEEETSSPMLCTCR